MRLKETIRYQVSIMSTSLFVFYAILFGCYFIFGIISKGLGIGTVSGMEMMSCIFLLVAGLQVSTDFKMLLQNGISRRTMIIGDCCWGMITCAFMACIESILYLIINKIFAFHSIFQQCYGELSFSGLAQKLIVTIAWTFCLYFAINRLGYLVGLLFYRMSKVWRYIVFIGVPVSLIFLLSVQIQVSDKILDFMKSILGISEIGNPNPYIFMTTCLCIGIICVVLSIPAGRKIEIKKL